MGVDPGRHVFGLGTVAYGVVALIWPDPNHWQQLHQMGNVPHLQALVYLAAAIQILGGLSIQWPTAARAGAFALGAVYLIFALLLAPQIIAKPGVFDNWANFFEPLSLVAAALIIYATVGEKDPSRAAGAAQIGRVGFGICVVSFAIEQLVHLNMTAGLVPTWIPPGQMFWAIATTIALALAAVSILTGRAALLAARCLTAMLIGFWLLVWIPLSLAGPPKVSNWSENVETLAIAGAAWVVADSLRQDRATARA